MPSPPPPPMGDPDAEKASATAWKDAAELYRAKADAFKAEALAERAAYEANLAQVGDLRAQVSRWCADTGGTIPPAVADAYQAAYDSALANEQAGDQFHGFAAGQYDLGVSYYTSGLPLYVPYGYPMASQLFYSAHLAFDRAGLLWAHPLSKETGQCAYAKYLKAKLDASAAYSALWAWFSTIS